MAVILESKNLGKEFGARGTKFTALKDINLEIHKGEFVGIMGPSGAGKSTLLNVLSTIDVPTSGKITIDGIDIQYLKEEQMAKFRRDKLAFIFQDYNLLDTLTVKENILLPLAFSNYPSQEIERRVKDIANLFGIQQILDKYPFEISGGQQQRTAASRAIISNPSMIFADEPTGALDSKSAHHLLHKLSDLNKEQDATILMVTHDPYAASFCRRILFIKDGGIVTELRQAGENRKQFFQQILDILAAIGGVGNDHV